MEYLCDGIYKRQGDCIYEVFFAQK